ncbi:MAG: dihydrofolate reductase [Christensenellaceae bacterium]|jgi:dihydrofolate reductase|nr:dihydrofolate reductase [Christensenellaceae bacterium]
MNLIVAVDNQWGIGIDNKLLFKIRDDLLYFKELTTSKVVIMGKNTLNSLPNGEPLKNRTNLILSSTLKRTDCEVFKNLDLLYARLNSFREEDIFVIGGEIVYRTLLNKCKKAYVTKVYANGNANKFFPNLDFEKCWELQSTSKTNFSDGYEFKFCQYINKSIN